ncbi:hypothetical protein SAMN04488074_108135 [Lentzea albidocapillata subsp. violacea]|uniref:Uncharacterized protein n=1 Tax=Lentzea albidocapillata subsp. violacea TaxID=128104 RepID=A0A1G9GAN5_9PSEU|nr:hypothetical protein [Lentzea albidocapillata]SDK97343.1 hypothetical protein SAMN04488074_108135 [Lentzea albidocapillata subsp. violacea]
MLMRLAIVLAALPVALVLHLESTSIAPLLVVTVLTALTVLMPGSAGAALLIGYAALVMAFADGHPLRLGVLIMIPALHLIHVTSALAAVVPAKTKIEPAALKAPARRFAIVQVITFAVTAFAAFVPSGAGIRLVEVLGLGALTVVIGVVALRI